MGKPFDQFKDSADNTNDAETGRNLLADTGDGRIKKTGDVQLASNFGGDSEARAADLFRRVNSLPSEHMQQAALVIKQMSELDKHRQEVFGV